LLSEAAPPETVRRLQEFAERYPDRFHYYPKTITRLEYYRVGGYGDVVFEELARKNPDGRVFLCDCIWIRNVGTIAVHTIDPCYCHLIEEYMRAWDKK